MKKIFDRLTALVMVMLMFIQSCIPAITSFAKEEELDKRYVIQKLETLKQDTYANFSLNLATVIDDKNLDTDTNVKFVLNATNINSNIKLLVRRDFSLYDERTFDTVEEAHKEFDRVDKSLKDQGLSLDVSVVQEDGKYRIHNNYVPQAEKEDFGDDYKVYSLKVVDEFDFDKEGLFNKLPENLKSTEQHRLQLAEERRLQQDGEVPEGDKHNRTYIFDFKVDKAVDSKLTTIALNKDENNPLEVKQNADLFAAILDDKTYSTYQTEQLPAEVTSSIEHKKEVAKAKAEAEAKAKAEADAKAKAEAEEKAKADAKAKEETDAKAKQEAEKIKAEEAKKTEEQKALDEKAKAEADAKSKQEADAKAKAEAEKLKAEAEAKKAAEEKAKKDLENKKLLGLVQDTEENQEEEPIIKKKETTEEVKSEPATPEERKQKAKEFDQALKDKKEEIKKDEAKKDDNNKEDNKGLLEGIKEFFGLTNLQKADRELKAILSTQANGLKEVQALLTSFGEKYKLSRTDQAKLMDDNASAIKKLIEKDADKNFSPQVLMAATDANKLNLDGKKFTVRTIFQTSNALGAIQPGQYFNIHLDNKLKVNDPNSLEPIRHNGSVIAEPEYDSKDNVIKYKIIKEINDNLNIPLNIPVDYNTTNIHLDNDGTFTVVNRVSGLGVVEPKSLLPEKIDKNGNPAGTIIEPDRHDVIQIFDDENNRNYSVNIDANGTPIVEQGELLGINWSVKVHSTDDLKDLGFKLNLTAVKGSGLKEIQNVMINGQKVDLTDQLEGAFGIVDSKHHNLENSTKDITYNFYTPVDRKQSSYMLDISGVLTKKNNKLGAARIVLNEGYELDAISEATSTRIGMNNRTTIQGKFDTKDKATWTVTDGVSSGDEEEQNEIPGLPLETRSLGGSQTLNSANRAVYGIDLSTGQMVPKVNEAPINPVAIPEKATNPTGAQAVGNIAVYEFGTNLTDAGQDENTAKDYSLGGVSISKYKDIVVEQIWNLPEGGKMPSQTIEVKEQGTDNVVASIKVEEETGNTRVIKIPNVKFWDFDDKGVYIAKKLYIDQNLPTDQVSIGNKNYKYYENANYYQEYIKVYQIRNAAIEVDDKTPGSFKVVKIDNKKDENGNTIKLPGAKFSLLGANVEVTTDKNGEATFTNIKPGSYTLRETKAPSGYKLDQDIKYVTIDSNGNVIIKGNNADFSTGTGASGIIEHNKEPNWPDFMNTMHYSTVDKDGNSVLYVYLKPRADYAGGSTNKDTVFNISLPGVGLEDANVDVYDIDPNHRSYYRSALEDGTIENVNFGADVINQYSQYSQTISGKSTQDGGYQIKFPSSRFTNDWGFMVKVTADFGTKESETLKYKWEVDGNPDDSHIDQDVTLNKTKQANGIPTVTITNEEFVKSPIEVTKFANSFNTDGKRTRLAGAEFVLKDSEGNLIANKVTDENGHVSFGEFPPGVYRLEEVSAPNGYQKSNVYFEVTVNESKEVSYVAKFLSGSGQPVIGVDYWIEKGEETQTDNKATVTSVNQRLEYNENKENSWGTKTEVWEAYMFESLKYHADITLDNVSPGSRFEIQFDPNLDFTQYFSDFPKIRKDGKDIADPYFDYNTNLLTYVFNNNSESYARTTVTIDLKGMIPDKYYFQNSGTKNFSVTVAPGTTGENKISKDINADYGSYDTAIGQPSQAYYFRDIYKGDDGEWYVTAIAYFNPLADSTATKTLQFNWMSTDYDKNKLINRHEGKGYKPAFDLVDVKVYETEPNLGSVKVPGSDYSVPVNYNMPLSFGVRPELDPNTYTLLYSTGINPGSKTTSSQNGVTLEYDPNKIITSGGIHMSYPLRVKLPPISGKKEGFIVEQKFKVTDMKNFINLSRLFYMNNGTNYKHYGFESAFLNSANSNTASADQTGVEIPKYYKEVVGLINRKYEPGNFKITKLNQANKNEKLSGAIFVLRPENGNPIYRTSDSNGEISFEGLAPGRYVLDEFRAPTGYQKTDKQWQVIVFNDGNVRITESSITGSEQIYQGNEINIEVTNKPEGEDFVVYKKDGNGQPLPNAEFKLTKQGDETFERTASSDENGLVEFGNLENGTYIIEEINPPAGYKKLDKKWVLVIDAEGHKKVYNYRNRTSEDKNKNLLSEANTKWINVKDRSKDGWGYNDNRTTGWVANSTRPFKLGTRIVAINKEGKYVIQRYVLNPEGAKIGQTTATIHREKPHYPNMTWYAGTEEYKVYKLEKPVTGYISDMRLDDFGATDITDSVSKSAQSVDGKYGEPKRLKLDFPATEKPIVIDVKIPYDSETGGVGTGMDWTEGDTIYWKSDFYERVDLIKEAGLVNPTTEDGQTSIIGAYISEDSLDVTNEIKTYGFKIKKVNDDKTNPQAVPGAKFKLTDSDGNAKEMITGSDGMISFDGLKPGTYTLEETEAAPGYEKPDTTWTVRVTSVGKVYIKDNTTKTGPQNPEVNLKIVPVSSNPSANRIRQYLANNSSSLHGVDTGLEFGPEMVDTALKAGTEFTIDTPSATKMYGGTEVNTTVKHLGSGKFEIEIHLTNKSDGSGYRGPIFELKFNDNFTFVDGSIETWKGDSKSDEIRWDTGYLPDENKIGMRDRQPIIGLRQTAKIKFQVQAKADLAAGNYSLIQPITYRHDETKKQFTIEPPTVTKTGPVITYAEKEVRTEMPIPAEATRRANPDMYEGDQREVFAGKAGYKIDIYKYKYIDGVEQANPEFVRNKETVNAEPKIIEYGTKKKGPEQRTSNPVTITEEIPFEIQETIDNNLKPGEVVIDTQGQKGKVDYKYSITYEKSEGESIQRPADWPANAPVAAPQPGERVISYNKTEVEGTRVAPTTQIVRKGPAGAEEGEKEIKPGEAAQITNKQVGLEFKVFKSDIRQRPLEGAEFKLFKADENYSITEEKDTEGNPIASITGVSGEDGNVKFVDKDGNPARLQPGYYVMRETKAPQGYKNITADWKIRVYEDGGILKAEYKGPTDTPSSYLSSKSANDKNTMDTKGNIVLKDAGSGIKYASRINYIDTKSKTFVQRIYIDTRDYTGDKKVNVEITPVIKREEIDTPGKSPVTTKDGVKTAYRTTYKIGSPNTNTDVENRNYEQILRFYDLADDNVTMINTARWRPFDWGFDEDQLNLDKGVYFIDVEGFYDDNITKEEIGKIEMNVKFQTERYFYSQAKDEKGNFYWEKDGSYQEGAAALGGVYEKDVIDPTTGEVIHKKGDPTEWGKKLSTDRKYPNWIGKEVVWTNGKTYQTGKIDVPEGVVDKTLGEVTTSVDIKTLYSSDGVTQIDQEGMDIINDEETYNITFTKHGQNSSDEDINSEAVTERRLEGGVFKLQEEIAPNIYRDLPESTVSSAFNGYFGFRGLSPGRYRLIEVAPPKDYKPITGPLLYFTVETIKTNSGKIVHPETGQIVDIKSIQIKFSDDDKEAHKLSDLQLVNAEGNTVNIKDVKSTDINVETTKIINPHTNTEVFLKDQKIVGENGIYDIAQAKIVPGSSGYISLEYDRANGVYQYVPEKTTSEKDGKLVDFVTSATAKNMGKIINTKPGKGEVTVKKVDQSGDAIKATKLRPGAEFKLTNKLNGKTETKTVGPDGTVKFDKLPIGQYQLEELKSPDGYINNKQIWNFTVGGEGLDPYSGPEPQRRDDLSDKITLESTMKVLNPETENHTPKANGEIHPHLGEAFEFENKFKIAEGTKINPGDYFTIKLTDNIDLNGISENNVEGLDILADGIGTVAKADYNRDAGTITYTFTDFANTYTLLDFSNKLSAYINLDKVQNSDTLLRKQKVGLSLGKTTKSENIKVVYDSMTARKNTNYDYLNLGSKIIKFNPDTGEFVHYYYINRDQLSAMTGPVRFKYSSEQDIENLEISSYTLFNWSNANLKRVMPESFGVNENDPYLPKLSNLISENKLSAYVPATLNYKNGIGANVSYIIKVTGRVSDENKMAYVGHGKLERVYDHPDFFLYVDRHDKVYDFVNSATADGKLEIRAVNPENQIKFLKVDQDNKPLSGATFTLYIQNSEGTWDVYTDGVKESGTDGIVKYSKLKPGKYKIEETKAPDGYDKIEGSILGFEVDASGRILRDRLKSEEPETKSPDSTDETSPGSTGNTQPTKVEEPGITPIPVVNKKKQEISFKKVDATDNKVTLAGAEFEVWHKLEKKDEYSQLNIYEKKLEDGTTERLALRATEAPAGYTAVTGNKLTSGKDGIVKFNFYDSGYYALKEIKAPKGYIRPKEYVREFVVVDGKIQESVHKTEMEVDKTIGYYYDGSERQDVYNTDIKLTINSDHEPITYTKGKSKITLSGLPYDNDLAVSNTNVAKYGISIYAKLVNKENKSSSSRYYPVNINKYTNDKGTIEIDLYDLVSKIEGKTGDSITSENTIELSMFSTLALGTTLEIKSNLVIGDGEDKISEERTFNIGTKGSEKVDHSYTFTNLGEPKQPIPIENKKGEYPLTGAMGIIGFLVVGAVMMATAYYKYRRKRRESALS